MLLELHQIITSYSLYYRSLSYLAFFITLALLQPKLNRLIVWSGFALEVNFDEFLDQYKGSTSLKFSLAFTSRLFVE